MNKINYILTTLLLGGAVVLNAQTPATVSDMQLADTLSVGYRINVSSQTSSYSVNGVNASAFEKSPHIDISKALYGKVAGLNVYQGAGSSADNVSSLSIHGHAPLVLIDGFPRDITDISSMEIESCYVLKDAAAAALYGMRGANGVILITTKRGTSNGLKVKVDYNFGVNTQFRSPDFADAYTYANTLNTALSGDGLSARYNIRELEAFRTGIYPYDYPNVDWWEETLNKTGFTHNLKMAFSGGGEKFRFYTVVDYYRDRSMLKKNTEDTRYDTTPTDTRLTVRTNLDVNVTKSTYLKLGIAGKLKELRGTRYGRNAIFNDIYGIPSAAFPIRHENGIFGGSSVYGDKNPVALLKHYGHIRNVYGSLLADLSVRQKLDMLTKGLAVEAAISFDNIGGMYETSSKSYRYMNSGASISDDGTLITTPTIWGTDSETLGHSQPFENLLFRSNFQAKADYSRTFDKHRVGGALIYDMQSVNRNGRNNSQKNLSVLMNATYTYDDRYTLNAVFNRSGSAYLPDGDKFANYPAISAAWIVSNEAFMEKITPINIFKIRASYGLSGWDGNLSHELWRQSYGYAAGYNFGENAGSVSGGSEGNLPVVGLVAEKSQKATFGFDLSALNNRLNATVEGFYEKRSDILVSGANSTSGIIGVTVGQVNEGIYKYRGFDASLNWNDKAGDFHYSIGATMSYLNSEVVNVNQAYQEYDYLYTKGNRVGQMYGLEAIGFFNSQQEINNSPQQTFSGIAPGDVKYKDQNGDNRIDEKDVVKMFGSSLPRFYFGFNLNFSYKRFELSADFQGMTGVTVSLLDSPLYRPLVDNGNISNTFLNEEYFPERKLQTFHTTQIIDYLTKTNLYYQRYQLPNIERHLTSFISMSTPGNNTLNLIGKFFSSFKEELTARIEHDDKEWFPYCLALSEKIKGGCNSDEKEALHLGDEQRSEDAIEALLSDLKGIMIKHLSGDYNENLCYAVIFGISSLEKDIKQHNRIRYRILTPMVSAMEKLCK